MRRGLPERQTHDYWRNGTTTLFAALNVLDGNVVSKCLPRHRNEEFVTFLGHIDANVPAELDVHLILDNYATHKHPDVKQWLAERPRYHVHLRRQLIVAQSGRKVLRRNYGKMHSPRNVP